MTIIAGFGFRKNAPLNSLYDALNRACKGRNISAIATPEDKATAPCILTLAADLKLPLIPICEHDMAAVTTATQSPRIHRMRNTGSVAEAAALSAAGPKANLIATRQVSADRSTTCALAERVPE